MSTDYSKYIWDYFKREIGNEYGVAGLMGNLQAESGLCPYRVEGDFTTGYTKSVQYTADVDSGTVSEWEFVNRGYNGSTSQKGYGLAQWTYYSRKQNMYDRWKSGNYSSIGDIKLACDFLLWELQNGYSGVWAVLKSATSVRQASDKVLHDFENPADQSEAVEVSRCALGQGWYDKYTGTGGEPTEPDEPDVPDVPDNPSTPADEYIKPKKMSLLMLVLASKQR